MRKTVVPSSCFAPRQRQRGLSLFEFAVAVAIIGVLAGVLLERFRYYQEMAEKARMQQTLDTLNAGLRFHAAGLLVTGKTEQINAMDKQNPFAWLDMPARAGYCGLWLAAAKAGCWYYDPAAHAVVYVPIHRRHLSAAGMALRFGWPDGIHSESPMSVSLRPLENFNWAV